MIAIVLNQSSWLHILQLWLQVVLALHEAINSHSLQQ